MLRRGASAAMSRAAVPRWASARNAGPSSSWRRCSSAANSSIRHPSMKVTVSSFTGACWSTTSSSSTLMSRRSWYSPAWSLPSTPRRRAITRKSHVLLTSPARWSACAISSVDWPSWTRKGTTAVSSGWPTGVTDAGPLVMLKSRMRPTTVPANSTRNKTTIRMARRYGFCLIVSSPHSQRRPPGHPRFAIVRIERQ